MLCTTYCKTFILVFILDYKYLIFLVQVMCGSNLYLLRGRVVDEVWVRVECQYWFSGL